MSLAAVLQQIAKSGNKELCMSTRKQGLCSASLIPRLHCPAFFALWKNKSCFSKVQNTLGNGVFCLNGEKTVSPKCFVLGRKWDILSNVNSNPVNY